MKVCFISISLYILCLEPLLSIVNLIHNILLFQRKHTASLSEFNAYIQREVIKKTVTQSTLDKFTIKSNKEKRKPFYPLNNSERKIV